MLKSRQKIQTTNIFERYKNGRILIHPFTAKRSIFGYFQSLENRPAVLTNIKKMDEAKSVFEKIRCVANAFSNINNSIKFSTGKNVNAGQEELTPILHYTIIKAQPQRFISQLNYIKCFMDLSKGGQNAFMVTQLESAVTFIMNLDHTKLKMSKEEFDKNVNSCKSRY